jgi:hypothetical protein
MLSCVIYADIPLNSCTAHSSSNLCGDSNRTAPRSSRYFPQGTEPYHDQILPGCSRPYRRRGYSRRVSRAREPLTPSASSAIVARVAPPAHIPARFYPLSYLASSDTSQPLTTTKTRFTLAARKSVHGRRSPRPQARTPSGRAHHRSPARGRRIARRRSPSTNCTPTASRRRPL